MSLPHPFPSPKLGGMVTGSYQSFTYPRGSGATAHLTGFVVGANFRDVGSGGIGFDGESEFGDFCAGDLVDLNRIGVIAFGDGDP